jgi:predicted patatin/cPLA2 family phospholipase
MANNLALIAEGGGMRGAYVYGAMKALEDVFNDQHGLMNFDYMAGTSASALTMMYTLAGQFHSDGLEIWSKKVAQKRFLNARDFKRMFVGPSVLDVEYLVDEIFARQHPLALHQLKKTQVKFYIPLLDVKDLSLRFYTNDTEVSSALLPYELIFMDKENPAEIYEMMKAASAVPIAFNKEIHIQGRTYVDAAMLSPFPLTAPIPTSARRICILTKHQAPQPSWFKDRLFPSVARSGFFHGALSNSDIYSLAAEESKNYGALLEQVESMDNCYIIKPDFQISSSDNNPAALRRSLTAGFQDVIKQKEALQKFIWNKE